MHARLAWLAAVLGLGSLLLAGSAVAELQIYEYAGGIREAARVRVLAQRLAKQNLLYQLRLGDESKESLGETVAELDRVLETLDRGNPGYAVPAPPSAKIRAQVARLGQTWGPLRTLALASPFDYLRRADVPPEARRGDPLLVRHFDGLAQALAGEAERVIQLYVEACLASLPEDPRCPDAAIVGVAAMLTERMMKQAVFVYAGLDVQANVQRLRANRDAYESNLKRARATPFVARASDPARGQHAVYVSEMWQAVEENWRLLRLDLDPVAAGRMDDVDLARALGAEQRLIAEMTRLESTLNRMAAVARARTAN